MEHAVQGSCLAQPGCVAARNTSPEVAFVLGAAASALLCLLIGRLAGFRRSRRGGSERAVESAATAAARRLPSPVLTKLSLDALLDDEVREERSSGGSTPFLSRERSEQQAGGGQGTSDTKPYLGRRKSLPDVRCSSQLGSPTTTLRTLNDGPPNMLGGPSFSVRKVVVGDPSCEEQRTSGNDFLRPRYGFVSDVPCPPPACCSERSRLRNGVLPPELRSSLTSSSRRASRLSFVSTGLGKRLAAAVAADSTALSLPPRRDLRKPASRPMSRHKSAEAAAPSTKATSGLVLRAATHPGCARQEPWTACSILHTASKLLFFCRAHA